VRIIGGIDLVLTTSELTDFLNRLDTMRGLDESGNNTDYAQITGRIYCSEVTNKHIATVSKYIGLVLEYDTVVNYTYKLLNKTIDGVYVNNRVTSVGAYVFYDCKNLTGLDFALVNSVGEQAFSGCSALDTLILRSDAVCTLANTNAFTGTKIASGTGYIYVPSGLKDQYAESTNWATYSAQFRAIEDYPDICGGE
jgi:hypothetical protein